MLSQDTSPQRSGAGWISGRRTTCPASKRYRRRFGNGAPGGRCRPWRQPSGGGGEVQGASRLRQATKTGAWMTVQPSTVNRTELGAQELRDSLFLWYGLDPPDLPNYCNACNAKLSICYALIAIRAASSRRVIMSPGTGSRTWPAKHSPPLTCANIPSSLQVAL